MRRTFNLQTLTDLPKTSNSPSFAPHLALFCVQLMFGTAAVIGKIALQSFSAFAVVAFRICGAALAFYFLQRLTGTLKLERTSDYWRFALYSLFGIILNQVFFITGLSLTTATNTSLIAVTIPVFATLIAIVLGFDKFSWRKVLGIFLAAFGVIYLIDPSKASFTSETTQGDLLIVANSLCYAIYIAISKNAVARNGALRSIAWLFLFGSIFGLPLGVYVLSPMDLSEISGKGWLSLVFMILIPTIGAYYLNAWALARAAPSTVAVYIYLQPLFGFTMAVMFLGEHFTLRSVLAGLIIFLGVFLVTRRGSSRQ